MLRRCENHGYFRSEKCPQCGEEGKFLMSDEELERIGRMMAGSLRHFPEKFGLKMDQHGWVQIEKFIDVVKSIYRQYHWLRPHHIVAIIETDPKGRYQYRDGWIRATYGHTIDVELDLPVDDIPDVLYYPATEEEVDILLETGLKPSDRKKVHLSRTIENALEAGLSRTKRPVIIAIDTKGAIEAGTVIWRAGKTVFLAPSIAPQFLRREEIDYTSYAAFIESKLKERDKIFASHRSVA